ncbi:MAG: hypothetical protein D3906_18650 [Candidatus Electrothrix sp. AUS1_2]|nr:hypothetical protein [Candidatus Electrothrix sp. AUS1_2]
MLILKNKKKSECYSIVKTDIKSKHYQFAEAVKNGLTSKIKFLFERDVYDKQGSLLFEKICDAPEYYPALSENEIFSERANEIVDRLP